MNVDNSVFRVFDAFVKTWKTTRGEQEKKESESGSSGGGGGRGGDDSGGDHGICGAGRSLPAIFGKRAMTGEGDAKQPRKARVLM